MKLTAFCKAPFIRWLFQGQTLLVMKITSILLLAACLQVSASGKAQRVTLSMRKASLENLFKDIRQQTGYSFIYTRAILQDTKEVTIDVKDESIEQVLNEVFQDQPLNFTIVDKYIVIKRKAVEAPPVEAPAQAGGEIHGLVRSETGEPLVGATIIIKKLNRSAITNEKGVFVLKNIPNGKYTVEISFVQYEKHTVQVTVLDNTPEVNATLKQSISDLDQVQITAFGSTTKRYNPGDITTITAKDIEKNPVVNVLEAIQNKVPGLFITQITGQPGGAFTFNMRGSTNFSSGAIPPLIVVDGVRYPNTALPLSSNTSYATQNFLQGGSSLNYLNPSDIASIDVLKDADATALYGSSGAYGVIIITTKKAKASNPVLSGNVYTGVSIQGIAPKLMNTQQYLLLRNEALKNDGLVPGKTDYDVNGTWPADRHTDFRKLFMGNSAASTNGTLTYSGGGKNSSYMISGSLRNNGNIQRHRGSMGDGSLRFSLNTNTDDNKFNLSLSGSYLVSKSDMVPYDFSSSIILDAPNAPSPLLPDGTINWTALALDIDGGDFGNMNRTYNNTTTNLLTNATLVYKPVKNVTLRTVFGYNDLSGKELAGYPTTTMPPTTVNAAQQTHAIYHYYDDHTLSVSPYAEYSRIVFDKGDLSVKAGGEIMDNLVYSSDISGTGFSSDALLNNPAAANTVVSSYSQVPLRSLGFYGIIKYIWDKKYIIDLNGRRDGSTRFGPDNRWGNFGSVAGAWLFSEENWMKEHASFLSFGKLRGSIGVVGGDAIGNFGWLSTYSYNTGTYDGKSGLYPVTLSNPNLRWEKDQTSEIGLELGFLRDRFFVEGNYYRNKVGNQLVSRPISSVTGFGAYTLNSDAVIRNSGWELTLNTANIKSRDFSWSTRINITIPTSKLLKAPTQANQNTNYIVGKPLTGILLYKYAGISVDTGFYTFTTAKGVTSTNYNLSNPTDKTQFIDLAPKYYGAIENTVSYKQFSLDFSFTFTNRMGKSFLGQQSINVGYIDANSTTDWLRRWQKPGDKTDIPKVTTNIFDAIFRQQTFAASTGAYTRATYARLQNVSFRYHPDAALLKKLHLRDLSIYLQGQNLLTISKFGNLDPENLNPGIIPPLRVFTGGINFSF